MDLELSFACFFTESLLLSVQTPFVDVRGLGYGWWIDYINERGSPH